MGGFNTISIVPYKAIPPSFGNTQKTLLARNEILKKSKIIAPYYMLRDAAAMDVKCLFNYKRFINNSDIAMVEGKMRLAISDKERDNLTYIFQDRSRLHKNYYQETTVKVIKHVNGVVNKILIDCLITDCRL